MEATSQGERRHTAKGVGLFEPLQVHCHPAVPVAVVPMTEPHAGAMTGWLVAMPSKVPMLQLQPPDTRTSFALVQNAQLLEPEVIF
jgi:hypothetical protein